MSGRPPFRVCLAVGVVAGTTLALQVLMTRVFAAVLFYHFGFLAISLALVGVGAGAIFVYVRPQWFDRRSLEVTLARWSVGYAILLVVVPVLLVRLDYSYRGELTARFVVTLTVACVLGALPPTAAGTVIALAIRGYPSHVGRVYAYDLFGAGLGALAIVPVLWLLDAPTLIVVLGALGGVAALLFAGRAALERAWAAVATGVAVLMIVVSLATDLYYVPPRYDVPDSAREVSDFWMPLSRIVTYGPIGGTGFAALFYDRVYAPVPISEGAGDLPGWEDLGTGPQSIGYELTGPGDALVIGGGGGRDIYNALSSGQESVDVIELNDGIRRAVDEDLAEHSGSPYSLPGVRTTIGDGRSILAARDRRYDQIHIGFTDTLSASSGEAFALSENNLYTLEAFEEYLDHLKAGGVLNVSRQVRLVGDEALRATVLTLEALRRHGVERPDDHVVVIAGTDVLGEPYGTILARLEPWTTVELEQIRVLAAERGDGILSMPGGPHVQEWAELDAAESPTAFCRDYRYNVCPPTDDQPFFFNMKRLADIGESPPEGYIYSVDPYTILMLTLAILLAIALVLLAIPLLFVRGVRRPSVTSLVFFGAIGLGFLLMEVALIQRFVLFLGYPTYALSIVLFALLVFTGLGAGLTTRFAPTRPPLLVALVAICVLIGASAYGLQPLLRSLIDLSFPARVAVTVALLAPLGISLGMAMPFGLRRLSALYPDGVPFAWGVNGIASVVASALAVAIAINRGFAVTTLVAMACYAVAFLHALVGRWPDESSSSRVTRSSVRPGTARP